MLLMIFWNCRGEDHKRILLFKSRRDFLNLINIIYQYALIHQIFGQFCRSFIITRNLLPYGIEIPRKRTHPYPAYADKVEVLYVVQGFQFMVCGLYFMVSGLWFVISRLPFRVFCSLAL